MKFKRLLDTIGVLDIFAASAPTLQIRGRPRIYSYYGIILSLLVLVFLIGVFVFFCWRLDSRQYPSFYSFEEPDVTTNQRILIFTPKVFQMGFGLALEKSILLNNTIYRMTAVLHSGNQTFILETEKCTPDHFNKKFYPPDGLLCIKEKQDFGKIFVTGWGQEPETWLELNFSRCDPVKYRCAPDSEINSVLEKSQWVTYYPEYVINPLNYSSPLTLKYMETPRSLKNTTRKQLKMTLKRIDFSSNNHLLFDDPKVERVITLKEIDEEEASIENNGVFLRATLVNTGIVYNYIRSYPKVQDILAQVFGLAGTIFSVLVLLSLPYLTAKMYEHIVNDAYEIRKKNDSELPGAKRKEENNVNQQLREIVYLQAPANEKEENIKNNQKPSENEANARQGAFSLEVKSRSDSRIKITFLKWVKSFFVLDSDISMLNKGRESINQQIDVNTLVMKILEVERLKDCIFTSEQRILFENFPKPVISLDYEQGRIEKEPKTTGWVQSYKVDEKKLKEVYKSLNDNPRKSALDIQLLSLYGKANDR